MNISACKACYQCGACYSICPHQAIRVDGESTFYRVVVDEEKCTDCGMCYDHCPANLELEGRKPVAAWGGWHRDRRVLLNSSSGGVFHGLASAVLAQGGAVFGAVYADDNRCVMFASTDEVPLERMRKSKYVESLVGDSFRRIGQMLKQGRKVLFCGTPCQCTGLRSYLGSKQEGLLTCDFACGGLPSHQIYQQYLIGLERRFGAEIRSIDFRPKTYGWRRYAVLVRFVNGRTYNRLGTEDPYLRSFLYGKLTVRPECLDCKFSDCHQSDLTIADFWLNEKLSKLRNEEGISLVLCNTEKGLEAIQAIRADYCLEELDLEQVSYNNKKTVTSPKDRERHDAFLALCSEEGMERAFRKFFPVSWKTSLKNWLRRMKRRHNE